ncbi:MAG TPA: apolipoprotein N-acyltransferase [Thermohalobaculum sp.]|nr:apolipoprotein N-acyltransferase [Thermohalobaculum sp.]
MKQPGTVPPAIAVWIAGRGRWVRLGLAILAGAAMTLGQAPVAFPWALFLALPVLVWLLDATCPRGAILTGWGAAFGYFVTGLFWIGHAFLVDAEQFAWMMPFAVTLLPAFLGLFWGAAFALARRIWPAGRIWRVSALAACLTLAEYVRTHVLTGFPWGLPGYVWVESPVMQAAAWAGPFGMTFLTLALAPLPLMALTERRWIAGALTLVAFAGLWINGEARLSLHDRGEGAGVVLRLVQPNAAQKLKWNKEDAPRFYARLLEETAAPADPALGPPAAVIWPETAVAFLPYYKPERRAEIAAAANGATVLLGALHARLWDGEEQWFNALLPILPDASMGPRYDKHHLVPFGEYLPYPSVLGPLGFRHLVRQGGFTAGEGPRVIELPGLPSFSALICYEIIFPQRVVPPGQRPGWILQVTNDAWFGSVGGPQQHLAQARIRAIEQGLPVVRAANTGISAVIDPFGRVIASMPLDTHGHIDARLPAPLAPTLYARHGDLPAMALVLLAFFLCSRHAARQRMA